jgi:hypothetical protein
MDEISFFKVYHTDTNLTGIGSLPVPITTTFENVLKIAIEKRAQIIVKPSRGKFWYIKGFINAKSFEEIHQHIEINEQINYKNKSSLRLIKYIIPTDDKNIKI